MNNEDAQNTLSVRVIRIATHPVFYTGDEIRKRFPSGADVNLIAHWFAQVSRRLSRGSSVYRAWNLGGYDSEPTPYPVIVLLVDAEALCS